MPSTLAATDGSVKDLCSEQGRVDAASVLTEPFLADAPDGLYRAEPVDEAAQDEQ